jgi:two-component sensor histidine kinase
MAKTKTKTEPKTESGEAANPIGPVAADETRLEFALSAGRLGYWEMDPGTRRLFGSDIYKANWGRAPDDPFTYEILRAAVHPDDLALHEAAVEQAIATRGSLDVEYRNIWPDGSVHWLRVRGHAVYDEDGQPVRMAGISLDVTDSKRVEETLREETNTLEMLHSVGAALAGDLDLERIDQAVTDAATQLSGAQFGAFFHNVTNEKGESYMLSTLSGAPREAFAKFPMPRNTAVFDTTFHGSGVIRSDDITKDPRYGKSEPYFGMPKGHLPVTSYLAVPVVSRVGEVLGGLFFGHARPGVFTERAERIVTGIAAQAAIAMDNARLYSEAQTELAERRRVERHQELLLAELNHRVKNTLAIVLSIATQTLRHASSAEAFRRGFETRIMALAEAHNLLTDSNWEGASLRAMIERVLDPYQGAGGARYSFSGDGDNDIRVGPKAAVALVMALNELATNAAKYGALSRSGGRVNVAWLLRGDADAPRFELTWRESGGPPVKPPSREGFGTRLIRGLSEDAAGAVSMDFARDGLIAVFELPLAKEVKS